MPELLSAEQKIDRAEQIITQSPDVVGLQSFEYLYNNNQSQKEAFISGQKSELDLTYYNLTSEGIAELGESALAALKALMAGERNPKSEALYSAIEYRYSEMFMLALAAKIQAGQLSEEERTETINWFKQANEAIYGVPEKKVFSALANSTLIPLISFESDEPKVRELQTGLKERLGEVESSDYEPYKPDNETLSRLGAIVKEKLGFLVEHVSEDKTYEVEDMVEALKIALEKVDGPSFGWQAKVVPNSSVLAVSAPKKIVGIGENRKPAERKELQCRILHEVGVHTLRAINAEKARWPSAIYGQDSYLDFEEALGTALEDAFTGESEGPGVWHYLTAGLAYGLDKHEPRDFREVYEIMWRAKALEAVNKGKNLGDDELEKAKSAAFTQCMRLFRGTSTKDKGVVYLKDLAYFKGQELVWPLLAKVQKSEDLDIFLAGKLDLTQPEHFQIAENILKANS